MKYHIRHMLILVAVACTLCSAPAAEKPNVLFILVDDLRPELGSLFDIGARVPLIIAAPGAKGNGKPCARVVQTLDLYPTLAALCGVKTPADIDGRDLRPLLDDPATPWEHPALTVAGKANNLHRAVHDELWRYIEWSGPNGGAVLIDEKADPHARTNLIKDPSHAEAIARLKALLPRL